VLVVAKLLVFKTMILSKAVLISLFSARVSLFQIPNRILEYSIAISKPPEIVRHKHPMIMIL